MFVSIDTCIIVLRIEHSKNARFDAGTICDLTYSIPGAVRYQARAL